MADTVNWPTLTLIRMAMKKCVAVWLGVIYDSQATNRKKGRLSVRAPLLAALLLVGWELYKKYFDFRPF